MGVSLVGPTLIAIDQIDAIVTASNSLARIGDGGGSQEQQEAQSIVDALAEGLMDLHEKKRRAVTVVSCLEATWKVLQDKTPVAVTARYYAPINLRALPNGEVARGIIQARVGPSYTASGFRPPYPTWPFAEAAFESAIGYSPRQLLRACEEHHQRCVAAGEVTELATFDKTDPGPTDERRDTVRLDEIYETQLKAATAAGLMDAEGEDRLRELLDGTLRLLEKHYNLPDDIDAVVQRDPDQKRPSLHGRLSFTFRSEGDREPQYCFRIIGHTHATAFQSRLKAAMTASGIDMALKFRHLFILRRSAPPGGPGTKTRALVDQFLKAGGKFIAPADDDLRAFAALASVAARNPKDFEAWLRKRRPLFETRLFQEAGLCPPPFLPSPRAPGPDKPPSPPPIAPGPDKPTPAGAKPAPPRTFDDMHAGKPKAKASPIQQTRPSASSRSAGVTRTALSAIS